ncbi:MAG TPA: methionyl-tRNA formyltransferase [Pseudomonadales bacterium]|nr:methionyl-tRNA formyltransferase [Pseudomonadales bacterium]
MNGLKIIFMGTAELSCASLEKLVGQASSLSGDRQDVYPTIEIVGVVTQPDKPHGRELKLQAPPVKVLAEKFNIPVLQPPKARDEHFISQLKELQPDLIVVVAYGHILPPAILDLPRFGCLNVHTSLLPKYRGAAPIQWAIANGETETGVTIMKLDAGMDTGPMLTQKRTPISAQDDSAILYDRLAQLGAELLLETIPGYVSGKIQPTPQPEPATYAPKIKKEDGQIDWKLPAQTILNRLRAFMPWPGAFTFLKSVPKQNLLKIWKAEVVQKTGNPEEIISADSQGITIACGKDALNILELQREGGRRMSAAEFLAGHPLRPGNKL